MSIKRRYPKHKGACAPLRPPLTPEQLAQVRSDLADLSAQNRATTEPMTGMQVEHLFKSAITELYSPPARKR